MISFKPKIQFVSPRLNELSFFAEGHFVEVLRNCPPSQRVELFRATLEAADQHLFNCFREGENVNRLTRDRSRFMDRLIFHAWSLFDWDKNITLLAVGGYGRAEMFPQSDIDLLILTRKDNH